MDNPSSRRIFLAIPTYSGEIDHTTHLSIERAVMEASHRGWTVSTMFRTWDSIVTRARNFLFTAFLDSDCTDMIFIDADIGCRPESIMRLMDHPVDVVGGAYRAREDKEQYCVRGLAENVIMNPGDTLIEVEACATGFLRISRKAAEAMRDAYAEQWYTDSTMPNGMKVYNVFDFQLINHQYWTEDYVFCRRYREIGGKIYVDPFLELDHTGKKRFRGRFYDYLVANCQSPKPPDAAIEAPLADAMQEIIASAEAPA